jgi:hypothetical protein
MACGDGTEDDLEAVLTHRRNEMPLYTDVHRNVAGAKPSDVASAHQKDLATQKKHGVRYLRYWHDPADGKIFCLCEAPSADAAHRVAHGLVAEEIYEVEEHAWRRGRGARGRPASAAVLRSRARARNGLAHADGEG